MLKIAGCAGPGRRSSDRNEDRRWCVSPRCGHGSANVLVNGSYTSLVVLAAADAAPAESGSVLDEGVHFVVAQPLATVQERQLDHEEHAYDRSAELLDELALRLGSPASRKDVVEDDDA